MPAKIALAVMGSMPGTARSHAPSASLRHRPHRGFQTIELSAERQELVGQNTVRGGAGSAMMSSEQRDQSPIWCANVATA
jgi:hypothetical protein